MGQSETKTISGVEIVCVPLAEFPLGAEVFLTLTDIAMPAIGELAGVVAGKIDVAQLDKLTPAQIGALVALALGDGGDSVTKLVAAFQGTMRKLIRDDPALFRRLSGELLSGCVAVLPVAAGRVERCDLTTPAKIQQAVAASGAGLIFLFKLLWFALEVNFAGPFVDAFAGALPGSRSKEASPPVSTTPTA